MKKFKDFISEDGAAAGLGGGPTNTVGSGAIAGAGVGSQGEPGVSKKRKSPVMVKIIKRKGYNG